MKYLIFLIFLFLVTEASAKPCSASETDNMLSCTREFFEFQGFYENDGKNAEKVLENLAYSSAAFEKVCDAYDEFAQCLKPSTIKNCFSLAEEKSKKGKFDVSPSAIHFSVGPICNLLKKDVKMAYSALDKGCTETNKSSCHEFAKSLKKCSDPVKAEIESDAFQGEFAVFSLLLARECPKVNLNCQFCPKTNILNQILSYRTKVSYSDESLIQLAKDATSSDISTRIEAVSSLAKLLLTPTFPLNAIVENGIHQILLESLMSKSSELQLQAVTALNLLIEEHSNAIIEAEGIPALIRTLSATDVKVLEKAVKILAKILEKRPSLKQAYLDENILEPLLLSFTSDITKEMSHDISSIVYHLSHENEKSSFSFLQGRTILEQLLPVLSELVYDFPSTEILKAAKSLLIMAFESTDDEITIDEDIVDKIADLIDHANLDVQKSAILASGFIVNWINTVTKDENGKGFLDEILETQDSDGENLMDTFLKDDDDANDDGTCTASQSNKMITCLSFSLDEIDLEADLMGFIDQALSSWDAIENLCGDFKNYEDCIGPRIIKNCINIKKEVKSMSEYMDFVLGWLYVGGKAVCETHKQEIKHIYSCITSNCNVNFDSSCSTSEIEQCKEAAREKCHLGIYETAIVSELLNIKKCIKNPDCRFCDKGLSAQIKAYISQDSAKNRWDSISDKERLSRVESVQSAFRHFNEL